MSQGVWILVAALVLATAFGTYRALRDGRFRGTRSLHDTAGPAAHDRRPVSPDESPDHSAPVTPSVLAGTTIDTPLGERATLLQFSSAFCAPCRVTRRVLADVARTVPGVTHVEVDAEHHLDLVRRLKITRTPTTLILDEHGREATRASGAPRKESVIASLGRALEV
jgi:thiol-disulfide isomerase/thioredoxin